MDMDVDMDVPYNVSVFLIRRPILEREILTYISPLLIFTSTTGDSFTPSPGLWMDVYSNSTTVFRSTADTMRTVTATSTIPSGNTRNRDRNNTHVRVTTEHNTSPVNSDTQSQRRHHPNRTRSPELRS